MCLNPLKGFQVGVLPSGKMDLKVVSFLVDHLERFDSHWHEVYVPQVLYDASNVVRDYVLVPCQKCLDCKMSYSRDWANRMMLENTYHSSSYFITLTYDDFNVPVSYYPDLDTGEARLAYTLRKDELSDFIKRLRRRLDYYGKKSDVRFYGVGEYGSNTFRPHYHVIVFGLELDDLKELKRSPLGYKYYTSQTIESCWKLGYSMVCEVSWETCAYVARYVTKKAYNSYSDELMEFFGLEREMSRMSRMPGIGRLYFDEHKEEIYAHDRIYLSTPKGGKEIKPPKYYDKLFDLEYQEEFAKLKAQRKEVAEAIQKVKLSQTDLSQEALYKVELEALAERVKKLPRLDL